MHAISFLVVGCDARRNATIAGAGDAFAIVPLPNTMYMYLCLFAESWVFHGIQGNTPGAAHGASYVLGYAGS